MKKHLNTTSVMNELKGASAFFRRRDVPSRDMPPTPHREVDVADAKAVPPTRSPARPNGQTTDRAHAAPTARTPVRRRSVKRYSFEFYEDQIARVKRLALEDQLRGGTLNMSELVRRALDRYLTAVGTGD